MDKFEKIMNFVIRWETGGDMTNGGYTNDPHDPGGETKWGISKRSYPNIDIKTLTLEEAKMLYKANYWNPLNCDLLDYPLALALMDSAVNCGTSRVKEWLRRGGPDWKSVLIYRVKHYASLNKDLKKRYMVGWINRVADVLNSILTP